MGPAFLDETAWALPARSTVVSGLRTLRVEAVLVAAILAIAVAFRFVTIEGKSFWFDEAYSAQVANQSAHDVIARVAREDTHPPLYYLLLSLWGHVFGTGDGALRSLGAIASLFTVAGTWMIGRRLGGPAVGVLSAFLTAVSPFQVLAAQEARMYALLGLLTLLSWGALLAACDGRRGAWVAYVIATTLALYTHYFAFLTLAGQAIFVLATARPLWRHWGLSQLAVGALFLPWLRTFLSTYASGKGWPFIRPPIGLDSVTQLLGLLSFGGHAFGFSGWFGGGSASVPKQSVILIPFIGLLAIGFFAVRKQPRVLWALIGYLVVPVVLALAFSARHNVFYPRYFSFVFPPFAMLSAFGLLAVAMKVPPVAQRPIMLTWALILVVVFGQALQEAYANPKFDLFNWRRTGALITAEAGPTDLIAITPAFGTFPFSRYFHGPQQIIPMWPYEFNDPSGQALVPQEPKVSARALFQTYAADHEVLWLVVTIPFTQTASVRLTSVFKGIYDLQQISDFKGITVFKMRRHSP